jgi:hypothetical protein
MVDFEFLFKISSPPFSAICDTKDGPRTDGPETQNLCKWEPKQEVGCPPKSQSR